MKTKQQKRAEALARTEDNWLTTVRMRPGWKPSPGAVRNVRNLRVKLGEPRSAWDTEN